MRVRGVLLAALVLIACTANAQSTANIGHAERRLQYEMSAGGTFTGRSAVCCNEGPTWTAAIGARWATSDYGGIRVALLGIHRRVNHDFDYDPRYRYTRRERTLALTASGDAFFRIWGDFGASLTAGAGIAPYIHGEQTQEIPDPNTYPGSYSRTSVGGVITGSVGLRYRWLFVEQQGLGVLGDHDTLGGNTVFAPVVVGIRF